MLNFVWKQSGTRGAATPLALLTSLTGVRQTAVASELYVYEGE